MLVLSLLFVIGLFTSLYGVLGAADFGAGFWDLFAGDATKGAPARALIGKVIGPIWEANHVWLIFILVFAWTVFPAPYAAIASTLYIPFSFAALGIVLRGAGFMFRKSASKMESQRLFGGTFAISSLLTPFFFGAMAGAVGSGRVPLGNAVGDPWTSWLNTTSLLGGVLAIGTCAFLAAVFLTREAAIRSEPFVEYFRVRALAMGAVLGGLSLVGIPLLQQDAPVLYEGLTSGLGLGLVSLSCASGVATIGLLFRRRFLLARMPATLATLTLLWGWGAAQYPNALPGVTFAESAAPPVVLQTLLIITAFAVLITGPALFFLFTIRARGKLEKSAAAAEGSTEALLQSVSTRNSSEHREKPNG